MKRNWEYNGCFWKNAPTVLPLLIVWFEQIKDEIK